VRRILDTPTASVTAGLLISAVVLGGWLLAAGADVLGFTSFLLRWLHVLAAMIWVGLVFFVNFVQLVVLKAADEQQRSFLGAAVVPRVAWWFRHAASVTVVSGLLLAVPVGYIAPALVYGAGVFVPHERAALLWLGAAGGVAMLTFVHAVIWPSLQVVLGARPGDAEAKALAQARVLTFARLNLVLAVPVTLAMMAAAHLY
jgi:uncharacterized membrane protein